MIHEKLYLRENRTDVTLTTYVIDHSMEFLSEVKRPAVLICPGGAYLTCAEGEGEPVALTFNSMGYQAFVLKYSTYMEGKPGIPMPGEPMPANEHSLFPNSMLDIASAMQTIVDHAEEWHLDPDQIILCGFSAGAHNCGMYSVYWKEKGFIKPAAAVLGYPLADYTLVQGEGDKASNIAITGHAVMTEEEVETLSVLHHVSSDTPPMFLWTTSEDEVLSCRNTLELGCALSSYHIPFEAHVFENGPHGLSTANECSAVIKNQVKDDIEMWIPLAHTWLQKRLSVNLPDKMPF